LEKKKEKKEIKEVSKEVSPIVISMKKSDVSASGKSN